MFARLKDFGLKMWNSTLGYWGLVAITFVVCRFSTWSYPYDSDHWIFYYVGNNWFHGGSLYVTAWDHKPPVIFFINGLMSIILGDNIILHRIFFTLVALLGIYMFYLLAKLLLPQLIKSRTELAIKVSVIIFTFWSSLQQFTSSGNNNENFGLVFYLGMLLSYFTYRRDRKIWQLFASGVCFSILFFMKGNFLLLGVPIGILMLVDFYKDFAKLVGHSLIFVLPLFVQAGAWASYFAAKGTLNEAIIACFSFSAKYSTSAWKGDLSNLTLFYVLVLFASPLIILGPLFFFIQIRKQYQNLAYWYLVISVIFGSFAFFAVGVPYLYYFEILMPVYALVATTIIFSREQVGKYLWIIFIAIFCFGAAINLAYSDVQVYRWYHGYTSVEAKEYSEIAKYVESHTLPTDKVFTADYGATFYQLSHRDSGSRFVSASVLLLDYRDHYGFDLNKLFISEMEKSQTKYVVVYKDRSTLYYKNKPMTEYFDTNYHLEKSYDTFDLLRRN